MSTWDADANMELDALEFYLENGSQKIKRREIRIMQDCDACLIPVRELQKKEDGMKRASCCDTALRRLWAG